ncbi:MAG: non-hydrolyzing UDP-N-acetylglucosamine 2-epimerase [bacterium]
MKRLFLVAGARPNFMKIAPIIRELRKVKHLTSLVIHTGQHYDREMSRIFFDDLAIPRPDVDLEVGSGSHAVQTAKIMMRFEEACLTHKPDLIMVVGDVNSTIACTLVACKLGIKTAHVEAGLRSFDRSMPEEINRILTDAISDILFVTCEDALSNLMREGIDERKMHFVGNVMIDTLVQHLQRAKEHSRIHETLQIKAQDYAVLTMHRPSNVDNPRHLKNIFGALEKVSENVPLIFPCHPRTAKMIHDNNISISSKISFISPLGYLDFLKLIAEACFALTDSGGIQEETTILDVPCLTLRENTERPITITQGTNILVGIDPEKIIKESMNILNGTIKKGSKPKLWDGQAAGRIVAVLSSYFNYT